MLRGGLRGGGFNEEGRFDEVLRLIEEDAVAVKQNRPKIGKAIVEHFANGKWYAAAEIGAKIEAPEDHVAATLDTMGKLRGTYGCNCEKREVGTIVKYRIFRAQKRVGTDEIRAKLAEALKVLKEQGKANMATMSPPTVLYWTGMIEKQIESWVEGKPKAAETKSEFEKSGLRKMSF